MRLKHSFWAFSAFTALFAVLAGFVFWGTWSLDVVPVGPDAEMVYPRDYMSRVFRNFLSKGTFNPMELRYYIFGPYWWQELRYALTLYLSALAMAYFCRGRGLSLTASYGGGILLAFCGYWMTLFSAGHFGWFMWMAYGVFAFGLADRAVRKNKLKNWLLLGATVAWAGFNQQDLWLLFTIFASAYFLWCCLRERRFPWKGVLVSAAVFVAIGLPNFRVILLTTLPERQTQIAKGENITAAASDADESAKRWEFVTNWSMPPEDALEFVCARVHGDTSCPFVLSISSRLGNGVKPYTGRLGRPMNAERGNYRQHSLYVGYVTVALALFAVCSLPFAMRRRRAQWGDAAFFAVAALVFFSLSLGRYFEAAYRVVFALPFGDLIRCPVKWHHLTEFSLAVLSAYGIDRLLELSGKARWRAGRVNLASLAVVFLVVWGAVDLAVEDRRYCAPVDVSEARRTGSSMQLSVLARSDFARADVSAMVRAGRIRSVANYMGSPEHYLVGVIAPFGNAKFPPPSPLVILLAAISLCSTIGVGAFAVRSSLRS